MQPPPARKSPYLKTLKHVHTEQLARLQAKNQHECDLLEDIKNFTKQRSSIEKTYAEALLKISSAYLNKKIPSIPDLRDEDENERWNVWNVWRTVLEENEKLARARLAAVEVFQQQIADDAKSIRHAKLQASKKCLDQLFVSQKELQYSVQELDRNKKLYFEEEHLAHDARMRANDAEEKLKKKKGSIFSSFTSLQRSSVKFSSKKEALEEKSTGARNEYILALAAANAHQDHYFNTDMENCLRILEGDVYEKLKEYLSILGRTELLTCSAAQNSFAKIRDQAQMLSRDYNVMCCVQYYPVLKQNICYPFDSCEGDNCRKLTEEHGSSQTLTGEAKKWAVNIAKQVNMIRECQRKLPILQTLRDSGHKNDPDDPSGPDIEVKIDEMRENIRKALTDKIKAEACIECLRDGGIDVDEYMKDIDDYTLSPMEAARAGRSPSVRRPAEPPKPVVFNQVSQPPRQEEPEPESYYDSDSHDTTSSDKMRAPESRDLDSAEPDEEDDIDVHVEMERRKIESLASTWDDPTKVDWGDSSHQPPSLSPPVSGGQVGRTESWQSDPAAGEGIVKCVALYSYTGQNPDELSILENEHLDLIGEGDGDGWVRARNYKGEEGYVPQNYVEVESNTCPAGYPLQPQISFSSVDYHVQETNNANEAAGDTRKDSIANGYPEPPLETDDYMNQNLPDEIPTTTTVSSGLTTPFINECRGEEGTFCRALYDYEATAPEELSFYGDQIIRILNMTPHNEDDGWWEGEYDGLRGLFPAIVAEECRWDGEPLSPEGMDDDDEDDEEESESGINPPQYTPPEINTSLLPPEKVVITEPTPETEQPTGRQPKKTSYASYDKQAFEMELSSDQQQKYQDQFGENGEPIDIIISDVPDVTVTVPDGDDDAHGEVSGEGGDGLEVTSIVITAATPMSEEHKTFPADEVASAKKSKELEKEDTQDQEEVEFEAFADFSQVEDAPAEDSSNAGFNEEDSPLGFDDAFPPSGQFEPEEISDVKLVKVGEDEMEAQIEELKSVLEPKKASLEIEDESKRLSRGESGESPVTPEELDIQNLAKLETLKESDA